MEKAYCIMMNSNYGWFPKDCTIISRMEIDTLIEYKDILDGKIKRRTVPSKYVFKNYTDARGFISALYRQGK